MIIKTAPLMEFSHKCCGLEYGILLDGKQTQALNSNLDFIFFLTYLLREGYTAEAVRLSKIKCKIFVPSVG